MSDKTKIIGYSFIGGGIGGLFFDLYYLVPLFYLMILYNMANGLVITFFIVFAVIVGVNIVLGGCYGMITICFKCDLTNSSKAIGIGVIWGLIVWLIGSHLWQLLVEIIFNIDMNVGASMSLLFVIGSEDFIREFFNFSAHLVSGGIIGIVVWYLNKRSLIFYEGF